MNDSSLDPKKILVMEDLWRWGSSFQYFHPVRESLLSLAQLNPVLSFKPSIAYSSWKWKGNNSLPLSSPTWLWRGKDDM